MSALATEVVSDLIDPETVQSIVDEVWGALFDEDVLLPGPPAEDAGAVSAHVAVTGPWSGHVALTCSVPAAQDLARQLLRVPDGEPVTGEDVEDAFGEIANVLGGNVKAVLPGPSGLGLPRISAPLPGAAAADTCRVDVTWREHALSIVVQGPSAAWSTPTGEE